jgi:hypothetical protein
MIEAKEAVLIAKSKAEEMLGARASSLEEIERESYRDREVWSITLGIPRNPVNMLSPELDRLRFSLGADPLQYKRFLIDVETRELVAMKLREVALP